MPKMYTLAYTWCRGW